MKKKIRGVVGTQRFQSLVQLYWIYASLLMVYALMGGGSSTAHFVNAKENNEKMEGGEKPF